MPITYKFKEARELIRYYDHMFNEVTHSEDYARDFLHILNCNIGMLIDEGFFSNLVESDLRKNKIECDDNFKNYLSNIYAYAKSLKNAKELSVLSDKYLLSTKVYLKELGKCSNFVRYIFLKDDKRQMASDAYQYLIQYKNNLKEIDDLIKENHALKDIDFEVVFEAFKQDKTMFMNVLKTIDDECCKQGSIVLFDEYYDEYQEFKHEYHNIEKAILIDEEEIIESLNLLINDEMMKVLKGVPTDELIRERAGLKIKYLKAGGYHNLADIFMASEEDIRVYGVSQEAANAIKNITADYALRIRNEIKIKLSYDHKTKAATNVVNTIYVNNKHNEYLKRYDEINSKYGNDINKLLTSLRGIGNGFTWAFLDKEQVDGYKEMYKTFKGVYKNYKKEVKEVIKDFKMKKSYDIKNAWEDFLHNSVLYYNVIEKVAPGLLGANDGLYGLNETMAKSIQDEKLNLEGLVCTLRRYQEWGVKYILHQRKVLLGDEMGLGKTVQAIATMVSLRNVGKTHFMVVCPASVMTNWCREIIKHSDLKVIKIHGNRKASSIKTWMKKGGVAVTNFESTSSFKLDENFKLDLMVVDEAHYIKNFASRRSLGTRNLCKNTSCLLFMTGTALENHVDEMIGLIEILNPELGSSIKTFAFMSSSAQFREKIASVYYRRKREDVLSELPDKIEINEWCTLNPEEEVLYEEAILTKKYQDARRLSWNVGDLHKSAKANRLKKIVDEAREDGRKVLVFSFFLDTINKLKNYLGEDALLPITGSVSADKRQAIIDEFDKADDGKVLLAQINSGGTGLNIQSASVVVICEPQFKPSIENQAISRAYRMGQARNVLVYRLLGENTIDEKMLDVLNNKQAIFEAFADKSVAFNKTLEIDETSFKDIIELETERIIKKYEDINHEKSLSKISI